MCNGHARIRKTLPVTADGSLQRVDFTLESANSKVEGRIVDSSGFPVRNARVVDANNPARSSMTDSGGRFLIEQLPAGPIKLIVRHPLFPEHDIAATAVEEDAPVEFQLTIGGGIVGTVVDRETGRPLASAAIEVRMGKHSPQVASSGENGMFRLGPLVAGRWQLTVRAAGYAREVRSIDVEQASRPGDNSVRDLVLELERGVTLHGTVRDHNGDRVVGAVVSVGTRRPSTDVDGAFVLTEVAASEHVEVRIVLTRGDRKAAEQQVVVAEPGEDKRVELRIDTSALERD